MANNQANLQGGIQLPSLNWGAVPNQFFPPPQVANGTLVKDEEVKLEAEPKLIEGSEDKSEEGEDVEGEDEGEEEEEEEEEDEDEINKAMLFKLQ